LSSDGRFIAMPHNSPLLILLSAPSGGGKTTLAQQLLQQGLARVITCTTRAPRPGEEDGIDYYFLDAETFSKRRDAGDFIEHATVYGHGYGTLRSEVLGKLREGNDILLSVDVQGAATIRQQAKTNPELSQALVTVFLTPPSLAILEQRLTGRGADAPEVIRKRLGFARQELAEWNQFQYLLISTTKAEDLRRMLAIIESERMRVTRSRPPEL